MKKTLITLAALAMASVAQATEVYDVLNPAQGATYTSKVISTNQAFTLTLAISWDDALNFTYDWQNKQTLVQASSYNNGWWSQALYLFDGGTGSTTLNAGFRIDKDGWTDLNTDSYPNTYHISTTGGMDHGAGNAILDSDTYNIDGTLYLAYTFNGTNTFTLAVLKNDGTLATMTATYDDIWASIDDEYGRIALGGSAPAGVIERFHVYNEALEGDALLTATKNAAIPEPTTATLSLLALAGLAARRRRK